MVLDKQRGAGPARGGWSAGLCLAGRLPFPSSCRSQPKSYCREMTGRARLRRGMQLWL